jgi:D-lactate dehydrogenase
VHQKTIEDIVALDIALKRNDRNWFEVLPDKIREQIHLSLYYGHFFCHVFHQDYLVRKGCNTAALKDTLLRWLDERGAEYPAEHNVGHLYRAKPALAEFYQQLDPCNQFNPGIGQTSKSVRWGRASGEE